MFSEIDKIIFPDSCEVIQVSSQQFVYPIFKCGRSSLIRSINEYKWNIVPLDEICNITTPITVFLRDPKERFISGVNTYIQHLTKTHSELDVNTVLFFIDNYLFLNRHYCPQFFWLINLAKYIKPNTKLTFCDYRDISKLTWRNSNADVLPLTQELRDKINKFNWKQLELYFFLDQILMDLIGKSETIADILINIKTSHPEIYRLIFTKTTDITNVLP